jgi:hypothetical protein
MQLAVSVGLPRVGAGAEPWRTSVIVVVHAILFKVMLCLSANSGRIFGWAGLGW